MIPATLMAITLTGFMAYKVCMFCNLCGTRLSAADRMFNGRIRFRKLGTNLPVCRCCAHDHPGEVE